MNTNGRCYPTYNKNRLTLLRVNRPNIVSCVGIHLANFYYLSGNVSLFMCQLLVFRPYERTYCLFYGQKLRV